MAEASAGSNAFQAVPVFNATIPKEGPKSLPVTCDFSVVGTYDIDLTLIQSQQRMSVVQSVFVDNTLNGQKTTVTINGNSQTLVIPAGGQAYLPLLAAKPTIITVASTGGVVVPMIFLNVPVPACVWDTTGSSSPTIPSYVYLNKGTVAEANEIYTQVAAGIYNDGLSGDPLQILGFSVDYAGNQNVNVLSAPAATIALPVNALLNTIQVANGNGDVVLVGPISSPSYFADITITNLDPVNPVIINYNSTNNGATGMLLQPNQSIHIDVALSDNSPIVGYSSAGGAVSNVNVAYSEYS
jgi:hypothetical protein